MKIERVTRRKMRRFMIEAIDVNDAAEYLATEGLVDTDDLWWLYDEYRIMVPIGTWVLALMWTDEISGELAESMFELGW